MSHYKKIGQILVADTTKAKTDLEISILYTRSMKFRRMLIYGQKILLGSDKIFWRLHCLNIACAYMCVNHEESEYVKGSLDYSDPTNTKSKNLHRSTNTTPPAKRMEQERVYQWSLIMFGGLITN